MSCGPVDALQDICTRDAVQPVPTGHGRRGQRSSSTDVPNFSPQVHVIGVVQLVTDVLFRYIGCPHRTRHGLGNAFATLPRQIPSFSKKRVCCSRPGAKHVDLNRGVVQVKDSSRYSRAVIATYKNWNKNWKKQGHRGVKRMYHVWEASSVGCCPTVGPRNDCRDEEMEGKRRKRRPTDDGCPSHATNVPQNNTNPL